MLVVLLLPFAVIARVSKCVFVKPAQYLIMKHCKDHFLFRHCISTTAESDETVDGGTPRVLTPPTSVPTLRLISANSSSTTLEEVSNNNQVNEPEVSRINDSEAANLDDVAINMENGIG